MTEQKVTAAAREGTILGKARQNLVGGGRIGEFMCLFIQPSPWRQHTRLAIVVALISFSQCFLVEYLALGFLVYV